MIYRAEPETFDTDTDPDPVVWLRRDDYDTAIVEYDGLAVVVIDGEPTVTFPMTPERRAGLAAHFIRVEPDPPDPRRWGVMCFRSTYSPFGPGMAALTEGPGGPWIQFDTWEEAWAVADEFQCDDDTPAGWVYQAIELKGGE